MSTLLWLLVLLLDLVFLAVAAITAATPEVASLARVMGAGAAGALAVTIVGLVLARARRGAAAPVAKAAMGVACALTPLFWLAGSFDGRAPSVPELGFLVLVALVAWGSWRAFGLLAARG